MKKSFKILAVALLFASLSSCGIIKKGCNCPKVSSVKQAPGLFA